MSKVYNPALQERLESYLANSGISQAKLAPKVGISQTALSQYRRSKYDNGDIAELERKLEEFFRTEEAVEAAAVKAAPYPDMFLNQNGVTFTKKVLEDLGYPAFVLCLLDAKARVFAIRSCKSNEPKGFKFSKPRGEQKGVVTISNKNLLDPLRAVTGEDWIPGKRYRVRGFWVADAKTMCFDLNEGVQEDFRPVTPNNDAE